MAQSDPTPPAPRSRTVALHLLLLLMPASLLAQTATLRGVVTDETGALVPHADVTLDGPSGAGPGAQSTTTADDGSYQFDDLAPGDYTVHAAAPNLDLPEPAHVTLSTGVQTLDLRLRLVVVTEQVTVTGTGARAVSLEPDNNVTAVVLKGEDLKALSDDPTDLLTDLLTLAGPSAGPSGGSIYIDGFSGGQLPTKDSIREIRINDNPFSPEFDKIGLGRIEIFTKPGTNEFHGSVAYNYMNSVWNSRNPYASQKAPSLLQEFRSNFVGPINRRASFTLDVTRDAVNNGSIVNAVTLNPQTLAITPYTSVPLTTQRRTQVNPRVDYQISENNTLTVRDQFAKSEVQNAGIGSFDLLSRAYRTPTTNQTLQVTDTSVWGAAVNDLRFQFDRVSAETIPNLQSPMIQVLNSFNGGGTQLGHAFNTQNNYEIQDYATIAHGNHVLRFGVRLREYRNSNISPQNFNGTFTFGGGLAPELNASLQPVLDSSGNPVEVQIQSIERYRRTLLFQQMGDTPQQIRALGGGASQFTMAEGIPGISGNQGDVAGFIGDDWKVSPNLTFDYGLRYEAQTNIRDWLDWAPRLGLAWAPGGRNGMPKFVIRAGFGIFYDRFALANTLTALRYNGIVQQQYVVTNPNFFPNVPTPAELSAFQTSHIIRQVDPRLRAPRYMQTSLSIERQLSPGTTLAVTYTGTRGIHMLRSLDINAPLPDTYNPNVSGSGIYPFGNINPIFQMGTSGVYKQDQLSVNVNTQITDRISLTGTYTLNRARSNTDGLGTFPANPYDYTGEYNRAATDIRHTVSLSGSITTLWGVQLNPLVNARSGAPFNITTGNSLFGTTLFNARPGIATDPTRPGLVQTSYGLLDPNPVPGEKIVPRNAGNGADQINVNVRITRTFDLGPDRGLGATPMRPYNLSVSMSIRNLLNRNNPGPYIGNITSPLFGRANQVAGGLGGGGFFENANNRRLEMQLRFTF